MRHPLSAAEDRKAVIGIGEPLAADDAAGVFAASLVTRVRAIRSTPSRLAEDLLDLDEAVVIDAALGAPVGQVDVWTSLDDLGQVSPSAEGSHSFSLSQSLKLLQVLDRLPPRLWLVTVGIAETEIGKPMSPAVIQGARVAAAKAEELLGADLS